VNYSSEGKEKVDGNKPPNNTGKSKKAKRNKHKKNKFKDQSSGRGKRSFKHHCCGDPNHIVKSAIYSNTWLTYTKNPSKR
jgi:hypothetical protein